jgi:hypothetical protein
MSKTATDADLDELLALGPDDEHPQTEDRVTLGALRAALEELQRQHDMLDPDSDPQPDPSAVPIGGVQIGERIHFLLDGLMYRTTPAREGGAPTLVSERRVEEVVTTEFREAATDGRGCWLDLDDDGQLARWGKIYFARGPVPDDLTWWTPGTVDEDFARDTALTTAHAIVDPDEKAAALREVRRQFGTPVTSKTIAEYKY